MATPVGFPVALQPRRPDRCCSSHPHAPALSSSWRTALREAKRALQRRSDLDAAERSSALWNLPRTSLGDTAVEAPAVGVLGVDLGARGHPGAQRASVRPLPAALCSAVEPQQPRQNLKQHVKYMCAGQNSVGKPMVIRSEGIALGKSPSLYTVAGTFSYDQISCFVSIALGKSLSLHTIKPNFWHAMTAAIQVQIDRLLTTAHMDK